MIVKTKEELAIMREGGQKLGKILQTLLDYSISGRSLVEIDARAEELIGEAGGTASFKTVPGYKWATCLCVNEVVVHGIPTEYKLRKGDVFTIDIGMLYKGLHTDTAWTKIVDGQNDEFLRAGEEALWKAIGEARVGNRVGHLSKAIEDTIVPAGFSIVKSLVGHGVGKMLHEDPQIPGFLRGKREDTPLLEEGMTIAIEVIYAMSKGDVKQANADGWTIATKDGSTSAVFEHTVAIGAAGPVVLTKVDT